MTKGRGLALVVALALASAAEAQIVEPQIVEAQTNAFRPLRRLDGRPDLEGFWSINTATTLQRPDGVGSLALTPEKAKELVKKYNTPDDKVYDPDIDAPIGQATRLLEVRGELRSSFIIEPASGMLPLTALGKAALARRKELGKSAFDNPEERPTFERCVGSLGDPPLVDFFGDTTPSQIVQTPGAIVIGTEDTHGGRVIDMTGHAPPDAVRSRVGYSAGRWEGDTLVVETDHFAVDDPVGLQFRDDAVLSRASRVVERFHLVSADELLYRFTIEDSALYEGPWLAELVFRRAKGPLYEYACHEGNYAMSHILAAARVGRQTPDIDNKGDGAAKPDESKIAAKPAGRKLLKSQKSN